ncbi:thioredoxin family protein [Pseudomonas fluorescens]|uniref:Thioredoxin family protein n=1 Tax=Pseudomonas fluorescens TaxID=294 RepID=A0A944HG39_PSEFL|nr:thioredoxin family protein [Pseudomonas fluorescens]MBT2298266.1 thioredoxin family protein [Pseudomonas fluorescens]MBT2309611.1 thioredoxin family protein [Pseudomonas fluorescens]MBT2314775.1 thioredoxin family protein [Pseudomonas fluorescens]MBT2329274.1 thioredoxin family protein [Pseudomonas fluorescens]MBT2345428.1 thioredoxin family protein [Pseudomonas fluorescens]
MSSFITHIASAQDYRKALKTWRPVVFYFGHPHCYACSWAEPLFCRVAETFKDRAVIYTLSTGESPRHPDVTGTPTVLFYKDGKLRRKLKGVGDQGSLTRNFAEHIGRTKPRRPPRSPRRDLHWLRQRLRTVCTTRRARKLVRLRATLR